MIMYFEPLPAFNILATGILTAHQGPFFVVPYDAIEANTAFGQWLDDAIVVGDLLEIIDLIRVKQNPYKLLAFNPAAVYFRNRDLQISYRDISELQMNARPMVTLQIGELE